MARNFSSVGFFMMFSTYLFAVSTALVAGFGVVGSLRWKPIRSRSLLPSSSFFSLYGSAGFAAAAFSSGTLIPARAMRSRLSFSSSALMRALSRASCSFSRFAFSSRSFSSCSFCSFRASCISFELWMRASSCTFASSLSARAFWSRIFLRRASSSAFCSSLVSFGLFASFSLTSSGSSMSASSPCSASQLMAPSRSSLPVSHSAFSARTSGKPMSLSCVIRSPLTLSEIGVSFGPSSAAPASTFAIALAPAAPCVLAMAAFVSSSSSMSSPPASIFLS
mmetsp:Transcript_17255/g.41332  ORF Transcript_17255/g.41332 Transcript_17255/m.41332 type:complete len:279 (+) Transcript_17255:341-1177(+)